MACNLTTVYQVLAGVAQPTYLIFKGGKAWTITHTEQLLSKVWRVEGCDPNQEAIDHFRNNRVPVGVEELDKVIQTIIASLC